ncbi:hypothetical protein C8Q75DRAFT_806470 [Abortiporus biennis]|nr:hypothetical protein C8Q75DRAFT_806470 [Abortiporus biennis]
MHTTVIPRLSSTVRLRINQTSRQIHLGSRSGPSVLAVRTSIRMAKKPQQTVLSRNFTTGSEIFDSAISTVIGFTSLFVGGIAYVSWYRRHVLNKIERAFSPDYEPVLKLARHGEHSDEDYGLENLWTHYLRRKEQDLIDSIIHGQEAGRYFMLLGPKGTGKTTMVIDAMQACKAEGIAMCDAHPDLEVFRLRLGKAFNFQFNEDSQIGLFQRKEPRDGGAALDIERALDKLEEVALRYSLRRGRPLVIIINNVHSFQHNEDARNVLLQLQQRAEAWSASGVVTFVFSSDDFWPFWIMRNSSRNMEVVSVSDLTYQEAFNTSLSIRKKAKLLAESEQDVEKAVRLLGGRLSYIQGAARADSMLAHAHEMLALEKAWLLSQIGLIEDYDEDVVQKQKWSSCSWLLLREFVRLMQEGEKDLMTQIRQGKKAMEDLLNLPLPKIPYHRCCQIMTRADFLEELDRRSIVAIDINHDVTPDSGLLLRAAREVVEEKGFDEVLTNVRRKIYGTEILHIGNP